MKLLKKDTRVNTEDSLGRGMDAVLTLAIFVAAGYGLDRLFGTLPIFMIVLTVIAAVGLFARFKYRYDARMDELEAARLGRSAGARNSSSPGEAA